MGWIAFWASPSYRARLRGLSEQAGVPWAEARPAVAAAGRMVAELPFLWLRPPDRALGELVRWDGAERIEAALAQSRGLVLLTPHLGCFEVIAQAYAERFGASHPMTALYRPAKQAALRDIMEASRQRPGLKTAPAQLSGVRQMIRALRQGETVGLLPDQVPPDGLGVWAPFFGRPAYTMTLASRLIQQTGAAWLLMWCERLPDGRGYCIHVVDPPEALPMSAAELPPPGPAEAASDPATRLVSASASLVNRAMEHLIRLQPGQYLWGYNRYKGPRREDGPKAEATSA
jgi:KDO2-lipid IV(A) lauroyltransferase